MAQDKNGFKEFLDSDQKFRREQIAKLQVVKEETTAYEFMNEADKAKINKALNMVQNYYKTQSLL